MDSNRREGRPDGGNSPRRPWSVRPENILLWAGLAAVYFAAGKLGLSLAFVNTSVTAVWPPTGIALAAFLLFGNRVWPGIFAGAFLVNLTTAGTVATSIGIGIGNTLEGFLGALLVRRYANGPRAFDRARDAFKFVFFAALVGTTVSATIGVTTLAIGGFADWAAYPDIWVTWWLGDAVGALVVAPFLITWSRRTRIHFDRSRVLEAALAAATIIAVGGWIFLASPIPGIDARPLPFVTIPPITWAAYRFGPRGAATAILATSGIAVWGTAAGRGPFVGTSINDSLLVLQAFTGIVALTGLTLAALVRDHRRAEEELLQRKVQEIRRLDEINRFKSEFVNMAAHELGTPLTPIKIQLNILSRTLDPEKDPKGFQSVQIIERNVDRLGLLVNDLLDAARAQAGSLALNQQAADMTRIAMEAVETFRGPAQEAGLDLKAALAPNLAIRADPARLAQVLYNLLNNAIRLTPRGGQVRVETARDGDTVLARVRDTGPGLTPEQISELFQPFVRFHDAEDRKSGTGLGLYVSRLIVELHGGRLTCQSEGPGRGATFTLALPMRSPGQPEPATPNPRPAGGPDEFRGKN